ncbi:MAG: NFACT family protein [Clostridiales bacterium]|jgi:predicted ribosome quality control (RQC) complex YloA/Tae2 family protein|nr:NFACT family protein [Clostridiales bacterium]
MPADALHYKHAAAELNSVLTGGRIEKITAPAHDGFVLHIRVRGENRKLYINLSPAGASCRLTAAAPESLPTPPPFLMHLRKYLNGATVSGITTLPYERVIYISVMCSDELRLKTPRTLAAEIMGRHSNLILTDARGVISDSLHRASPAEGLKRTVFPGLVYSPPPAPDKIGLGSKTELLRVLSAFEGGSLQGYLQKHVSGFAPASFNEAIAKALGDAPQAPLKTADAERVADALISMYESPALNPCARFIDSAAADFYIEPYKTAPGGYVFYKTLNEAMDAYYSAAGAVGKLAAQKNKLLSALKGAVQKYEKRIKAECENITAAADFERDRIAGELLTANVWRVEKGQKSVLVDDYYTGGQTEIALDEKLSAQANAQKYFKLYNKKKRAAQINAERNAESRAELDYLESVAASVNLAENADELKQIESELTERGLLPAQALKRGAKKPEPADSLRGVYKTLFDGYAVFAGKNNLQNDALTRSAADTDIWLHVKAAHGSHTLIKNGKPDFPPDAVLLKAAALAAYYSERRAADKTEVDYAFAKNVFKPRKAPPGKALYENHFTVIVKPEKG